MILIKEQKEIHGGEIVGEKSNIIEVPVHICNQIIKMYMELGKLKEALNREPTDKEIADRLEWPEKRVIGLKRMANEIMDKVNYTGDILDLLGKER